MISRVMSEMSLSSKKESKRYRFGLEIVRDMLSIASVKVRKTRIMYAANLSYLQSEKYLKMLLENGLLERLDDSCYLSTRKGEDFLQMYEEHLDRSKRLDEEIIAAQMDKMLLESMCFNNGASPNHMVKKNPVEKSSFATRQRQWMLNATARRVKGVVLAAGEGSRIRSVTYGGFPKELLPIGNIPTIRFPIEGLRLAGVKDILIVIAPRTKHGIIDGLQSGSRFAVNISYVVQEIHDRRLGGLGTAILSVRNNIQPSEDFVVACGDTILCDFSSGNPLNCLDSLIHVHRSVDALATVMVCPSMGDPTRFGVVKFRTLNDENGTLTGQLEGLVEKPNIETAKNLALNGYYYIIAGYYIFKPEIFSYIEKTSPSVRNEVQITDAMALALRNGERIHAVVHARNNGKDIIPFEYWDVGIPEDYKNANRKLLNANIDALASLEGVE